MVAGSRVSRWGHKFKRCGPILLAAWLLTACGFGAAAPQPGPSHTPTRFASPSPSALAAASSYWVLATLGLRLHQMPDPASTTVTVIRPGAQLDVSGATTVGSTKWLHVHAHDSPDIDGWVLDDPNLLTDIPVQLHDDPTLGYTLLFPTAWTFTAGPNIGVFSSADAKVKLTVETAGSVAQLPPVPTAPGQLDHQEGPVDVYGQSPLLSYYRLTAGGWELDLSFLYSAGRAFGFVYRVPTADASILKVILNSFIIR